MESDIHPSRTPAHSGMERFGGAVLMAALFLGPLIFSEGFASFLDPKLAVLAGALCALSFLAFLAGRAPIAGLSAYLPLWLVLATGVLFHLFFNPSARTIFVCEGAVRGTVLLLSAAYAFPFLGSALWRSRIMNAIQLSAVAVGALGLLQYARLLPWLFPEYDTYPQRVYSVFGNQDLFGGYMALALGLSAGIFFRQPRDGSRTSGWVSLLLLPPLLISGSRSAWLAAAVGVGVGLIGTRQGVKHLLRLAPWAAAAVLLVCLAAPAATTQRLAHTFSQGDEGARIRLSIWRAGLNMVGDAPLMGHGLGSFQYHSPAYMGRVQMSSKGPPLPDGETHAIHAHSDPLELAIEAGLVGVALAAWMLFRLRRGRGPEWGGGAALLTFALFNNVWHSPPHAFAGLLFAGSLMASPDTPSGPKGPGRVATVALCGSAWIVAVLAVLVLILPGARWIHAQNTYARGEDSEEAYGRVFDGWWPAPRAHLDWAVVLTENGRAEEALHHVHAASAYLDTWEVHYLRGVLYQRKNRRDEAKISFEESLLRWPGHVDSWEGLLAVSPVARLQETLEKARRWLSPQEFAFLDGLISARSRE